MTTAAETPRVTRDILEVRSVRCSVGDHVRPGGPSEQETLASLVWDELNPYIRDRLLAWAESIESKRAERRAGAAS